MTTTQQVLVFAVGENRYAMDILHLKEVGRMPRLEMDPSATDVALGVVRLHGRPMPIYDLAPLVGEHPLPLDESQAGTRTWMLVSRCGEGERLWRVGQVEDILDYDPGQVAHGFQRNPGTGPEGAELGVLDLGDGLIYVIAPELVCTPLN